MLASSTGSSSYVGRSEFEMWPLSRGLVVRASSIFAVGFFLFGATELPAAVVSGIEIQGTVRHGDAFSQIECYFDNYIVSGAVVNSFGEFQVPDGTTLSPLPVRFNRSDPNLPTSPVLRHLVVPGVNDASSGVQLQYGRVWSSGVVFRNDLAYISPVTTTSMPFSFDFGNYHFSAKRSANGYDLGVLDIFFAGFGSSASR